MSVLNWVLTGFLALGFLAGVHFMWTYTRRWAWWKDEHGAHLGIFTLSLTLIMGLYLIRPFVDPETFGYIRGGMCCCSRLTASGRTGYTDAHPRPRRYPLCT
jgi:hypothetical protein